MKKRWVALAIASALTASGMVSVTSPATAAPLASGDFLKVSGNVLKKNSGTGATINLRGTNLGGWLTHEDWMSPLGEFALDRAGWTATASAGSAAAAIDGADSTRWTTSAAQTGGEWLSLDLGATTRFNRVAFNHTDFAGGDFPRGYTIQTSPNGSTWTTVSTGAGSSSSTVTSATFSPTAARYLRVNQTGSAGDWWSVGEINVFNDAASFVPSQWTATSSGGTAASAILDGNLGTRWTSNAAQAAGQWVQLDLGARMTINNVWLDTAKDSTDEGDYPRGYTVQVSNNGSSWTNVATGTGTFKATNINFPPVSTRYVRVNQTGTAAQWWSIGEMAVALNSDDYNLQLTMNQRFGASGAQTIRNAHEDTWITTADLDNIAAMGTNLVRVPIGWTTFLNPDGTWKSNPWTKLDWIVSELQARGVYTLLDLHTVPGGGCPWGSCGRIGPNPNGFWGSSTYQSWVTGIWQAIATRYNGNPAVAGYDLINEPLLDFQEDAADVAQKSAVYNTLYNAVRAIDPNHTIYIGAFFGYNNVAPPSTYGWTNVVYELHPYDMPNAKDWNAQNQLVTDQLNALPGLLANPGVPVLFGEYSLYYYDDVWARWMAGLNSYNQSWTNWTYKVKGGDADGQGYWGFYSNNPAPVPVINSDSSATFIEKLQRFGTANFTKNERMTATVTKYAGGLSTFNPVAISRAGWTATASATGPGSSLAGGIDGNGSTRWNSGAAQTPGQWYQIDLGSSRTIAQVTVQTPGDAKEDYPRGFQLQFSTNETTWTTVGSGIGFGWKRPITVTPQSARYIRITQTGSTPTNWWSIDEVTVYSSY
ncbi:aryl-phospho-beta-D-glucosidase BglC (GH1 family) [Labedella gwakjiensis]|uniref:Exo-1,3-beta-glucanase D n=1 Tax=Labedella gwakjiensis TaxID=390269 RepID=A0A2P8GTL1_9MICO|nr:discoidin domain-containing protein [Labedella gwakjiensis]PSL37285.1 aryl-phospho-beta-D-glucosidase BglC (GH1 family) [Labedella gwakjiensis]RUQ84611.1 hypothetical protein ELQ93_13480 [Labedella gwakjiensis]